MRSCAQCISVVRGSDEPYSVPAVGACTMRAAEPIMMLRLLNRGGRCDYVLAGGLTF